MTQTLPPVDVNQAFHTERLDQLAEIDRLVESGQARRLPGGRIQITNGLDACETWTQQGPLHGLDLLENGNVALYTAHPTWHALEGKVFEGGVTDIDTVIEAAGLGYEVIKVPALYTPPKTSRNRRPKPIPMPDRFLTVRTDTGAAFDVVGGRYVPWQNAEVFTFLQDLVGISDVIWESAGVLRGGKRAFVSMRIPTDIRIEGIDDVVRCYIVVINSHDGSTPFRVLITPWRPVCRNTERFALRDASAYINLRHTSEAKARVMEARRVLGVTSDYFEAWAAEEALLARAQASIDDAITVIDEIWTVKDDASEGTVKVADARRQEILSLFDVEIGRVGNSLLAVERAATGWMDNLSPNRPRSLKGQPDAVIRATAVLEGDDDRRKARLHERLMLRVR